VNFRSFIASAALCCALPAAALTTRPDRDDAEYLELASRYPSAIRLAGSAGEGVLVNPRWVLTAAHRARPLADARRPEVAAIFIHPEWKGGADNDVALVLLKEEMRGVEPTPVYRADDEAGRTAIVTGHGGGRKRAAINTVERVTPLALAMRIKPLDDASDLQGALTPAETGAPLFFEVDGRILVGGIAQATAEGWETYSRASAFAGWIEATMLGVARREAEELLGSR
jgi:hypothetical protein